MSPKELEILYPEILNSLGDYALLKNENGACVIYHVKNQSYVIAEEYSDHLIRLMVERNVRVVKSADEVNDPDFVRTVMKWDDRKNTFVETILTECTYYNISKANFEEVSQQYHDKIHEMFNNLIFLNKFHGLIASLVRDHTKDFRIDVAIDKTSISVRPRTYNTIALVKLDKLMKDHSAEQLKELWKDAVSDSTEDGVYLNFLEAAQKLKYLNGRVDLKGCKIIIDDIVRR